MTTPSKLSLKKKNRQKPAFPSRSDHDDEKGKASLKQNEICPLFVLSKFFAT